MSGKARRRLSKRSIKRRFLNKRKIVDFMKEDLFRECVLLGCVFPSPSFHPIHRGWEITSIASIRPDNTGSLLATLGSGLCVACPLTWVDAPLPMGGRDVSPTFNLPWADKARSRERRMALTLVIPFSRSIRRGGSMKLDAYGIDVPLIHEARMKSGLVSL